MKNRNREVQRVRDPVHGLIVFGGGSDPHQNETDLIAWRLLNTREFQRLRRIRQLGFSDLVFPGATHSRFAHSVGVYHVARKLVDVVRRRQLERDEQYEKERTRVVLLAALLHDIGHGPFSHVFEEVATDLELPRRHEDWGANILQGDTEVNSVLREVDEELPKQIGKVLKDEVPKDIYATIVSSQFDADRLDYLQRDRLMTGVEFAHLDIDWLFDCIEVGSVIIGQDDGLVEARCLYLGPKGLQVAEEYLEARFRLYTMVYMHKTTRAAEKMLVVLLKRAVAYLGDDSLVQTNAVLRYLTPGRTVLDPLAYLDLDDTSVWSTIEALESLKQHPRISELASRLRHRDLYKCLDIGRREHQDPNLYQRLRHKIPEAYQGNHADILFDDAAVALYKQYDFKNTSALKKVLVKTHPDDPEPRDIAKVSPVIQAFKESERIQRVYAPERSATEELQKIMEEIQ